jgi:hypothetical protein
LLGLEDRYGELPDWTRGRTRQLEPLGVVLGHRNAIIDGELVAWGDGVSYLDQP